MVWRNPVDKGDEKLFRHPLIPVYHLLAHFFLYSILFIYYKHTAVPGLLYSAAHETPYIRVLNYFAYKCKVPLHINNHLHSLFIVCRGRQTLCAGWWLLAAGIVVSSLQSLLVPHIIFDMFERSRKCSAFDGGGGDDDKTVVRRFQFGWCNAIVFHLFHLVSGHCHLLNLVQKQLFHVQSNWFERWRWFAVGGMEASQIIYSNFENCISYIFNKTVLAVDPMLKENTYTHTIFSWFSKIWQYVLDEFLI